jgi:hypothetical protein
VFKNLISGTLEKKRRFVRKTDRYRWFLQKEYLTLDALKICLIYILFSKKCKFGKKFV